MFLIYLKSKLILKVLIYTFYFFYINNILNYNLFRKTQPNPSDQRKLHFFNLILFTNMEGIQVEGGIPNTTNIPKHKDPSTPTNTKDIQVVADKQLVDIQAAVDKQLVDIQAMADKQLADIQVAEHKQLADIQAKEDKQLVDIQAKEDKQPKHIQAKEYKELVDIQAKVGTLLVEDLPNAIQHDLASFSPRYPHQAPKLYSL